MILLSHLDFREKVSIELQCGGQMVEGLLEVSIFQVCFTQLGVGSHQDEQIFLVDVYQQLAKRELLDSDLDDALGILRHREFIECLVSLDFSKNVC